MLASLSDSHFHILMIPCSFRSSKKGVMKLKLQQNKNRSPCTFTTLTLSKQNFRMAKASFDTLTWTKYLEQKETWSPNGRFIQAQFDDDAIVVYQAYNRQIGAYAVKHKKFLGCPAFSPNRMTWIKTNFLWMMYRYFPFLLLQNFAVRMMFSCAVSIPL